MRCWVPGNKCEFKKLLISYLSHRIDSEEVNAIRKAPIPKNVLELHSFFSFCELLLPLFKQYQPCSSPIIQIITKVILWKRRSGKAFGFEQSKGLLMSTNVLVHYNGEL